MGASPTGQRLQREATGAAREETKWLKPSDSVSRRTVTARVCRPFTRVNAEQASKRKRGYGEGTRASPDERSGNRQTGPTAIAPHLDIVGLSFFQGCCGGSKFLLTRRASLLLFDARCQRLFGLGGCVAFHVSYSAGMHTAHGR